MPRHHFVVLCAAALVVTSWAWALADSTDQQVNDTRTFIEYVFGFKLDAPSVQAIRNGLAIDMASDPNGTLTSLKDMNQVMTWVRAEPASGPLLRSYIEPELVAAFQTDTSSSAATAKAMVAAWRAHNKIVAEGQPPLRQDVVNAYIAMFEFISKQTGKPVPAEVASHARFTARVAAQYAAAPAESQLKFNRVQTLWSALQTLWARSTPAERAALRQQLRASVAKGSGSSAGASSATTAPQSGFSGQISGEEKYKEKLFVDTEAQVMFATWSNPFAH